MDGIMCKADFIVGYELNVSGDFLIWLEAHTFHNIVESRDQLLLWLEWWDGGFNRCDDQTSLYSAPGLYPIIASVYKPGGESFTIFLHITTYMQDGHPQHLESCTSDRVPNIFMIPQSMNPWECTVYLGAWPRTHAWCNWQGIWLAIMVES